MLTKKDGCLDREIEMVVSSGKHGEVEIIVPNSKKAPGGK